MEEKIYDRQVTKQSLSFRVVDQQQIERHFTTNELAELYTFEPDMLDDPSGKKRKAATPMLPKVKLACFLLWLPVSERPFGNVQPLSVFRHLACPQMIVPTYFILSLVPLF